MVDNETEYWFNSKTNQVEVGKQSIAVYRIGPFKTRTEAEQALAILAARSKAWREEQERED
jgi:cell division septation protein DedD